MSDKIILEEPQVDCRASYVTYGATVENMLDQLDEPKPIEWKDSMSVEELKQIDKQVLENYNEEELKKAVATFCKGLENLREKWVELGTKIEPYKENNKC